MEPNLKAAHQASYNASCAVFTVVSTTSSFLWTEAVFLAFNIVFATTLALAESSLASKNPREISGSTLL